MCYVNLMVATKQKPTVDTQKIKGRESNSIMKKTSIHKGKQQERKEAIWEPQNRKKKLMRWGHW